MDTDISEWETDDGEDDAAAAGGPSAPPAMRRFTGDDPLYRLTGRGPTMQEVEACCKQFGLGPGLGKEERNRCAHLPFPLPIAV